MKTIIALIAAALFASSAQADITHRTGFVTSSNPASYTKFIEVVSTDQTPMNAYVAAFDGKNIYWLTPSGWTTSNSATFPVAQKLAFSGKSSSGYAGYADNIMLFYYVNITGINATIYYGVGIDQNDMIAKNQIWTTKIGLGASVVTSPSVSNLVLSCPLTLSASSNTACTATASYSDSTSKAVTPVLTSSNSSIVSIVGNTITAGPITADTPVTITATYTENGVTKTAVSIVTIKAAPSVKGVGFVNNGDGTVTDKATGLTWKRCAEGQGWSGSTCSGTAQPYFWSAASALTSTFAGKSDWRLPTMAELVTIVARDNSYPAIDSTSFPNTPVSIFWSASVPNADLTSGWSMDFINGYGGISSKTEGHQVRLVRGGQPFDLSSPYTPTSDFIDNGNGVVTHNKTNLMWKRCPEGMTWTGSTCSGTGSAFSWTQATSLTSNYAGYSGWRLPTENELLSIVEWNGTGPAINMAIFPNTADYFWSASSYALDPRAGWCVHFFYGYAYPNSKSNGYQVRLVRNI